MTPVVSLKILVVEDVASDLDILLEALGESYTVCIATDGVTALDLVAENPPDIVLMDVLLPGEVDGFEVCRRLKANPKTQAIPIIFLTALTGDVDEEKGLLLGAADYIAKPFNPALVRARVSNHLALYQSQIETLHQRNQIEESYRKLREVEEMKDNLLHLVVHDMRSPLSSIGCCLDLIDPMETPPTELREKIALARGTVHVLCEMVNSLLDISRMESGQMPILRETCDLQALTGAVLERLSGLLMGRSISITTNGEPVRAYCDSHLMERIIQNLLGNALKHTPEEANITIELSNDGTCARFTISDTGPGIPTELHDKVFQKFGQVETGMNSLRSGSGLGLTFCKYATEAQGGNIQLVSDSNRGATFHVRLPKSPE